MTARGSSAGTNPANEPMRFDEYPPVVGSTFWAVPVLPATGNSSSRAFVPVPPSSSTTRRSSSVVVRALRVLMTRRTAVGSFSSTTSPPGATIRRTT